MDVRSNRRAHQDSHRRVLLVGFPPLMLSGLEPALARVAEVVSVPFPGTAFDRAAEEFDPDMVVVNVTYLDQAVIQPLIANRFASAKPVVAYLSDQRDIWIDDLQGASFARLDDSSLNGLVTLASGSLPEPVVER
jgi:hypothetical protein